MKPLLVVAWCVFFIAVYQNSVVDNSSYAETVKVNKASLFLIYTTSFDNFYLNNSSATGDVTNKVTLPSWLPADNTVKMFISGGYGYVFMPSTSGVFSELVESTNNSTLVGFSDATSITTLSGKLAKPSFIPPNYIVYIR